MIQHAVTFENVASHVWNGTKSVPEKIWKFCNKTKVYYKRGLRMRCIAAQKGTIPECIVRLVIV